MSIGAAVAVAASATATAMQIRSANTAHRQQRANAEAQEAQERHNAKLESMAAEDAERTARENARRKREADEAFRASQRALLGKSGLALSEGSPLAVLGATAADQERTAMDVMREGYLAQQQHITAAEMHRYRAGVARASAPSGGSLLTQQIGLGAAGVGQAMSAAQTGARIGSNFGK
jgi:ABC-type transport system involved in cytochrome bd biosynthesis fused ATPase/permease subunit